MQKVSGHDFGNGAFSDDAVYLDPRGFGLQADELANGRACAPLGARLEQATKEDQDHDHRRRLEIDVGGACGQQVWRECGQDREAIGRKCPDCDKGIHVRGTPEEGRQALGIEHAAWADQNDAGQSKLDKLAGLLSDGGVNPVVKGRDHVPAHFQHKDRQRQQRCKERLVGERLNLFGFAVCFLGRVAWR